MSNALNVNSSNFEEEVLNSNQLTIVKFGAAWCGPCKKMDPIIDQLAAENPGVKVTYVDIDKESKLTAKYGVLSVPSTLFFKEGKVVDSLMGAATRNKLEALVKKNI